MKRGSVAAWLIDVSRSVVNAEFRRAAKDRATARLVSGRELLDDSVADVDARLDAQRAAHDVYAAVGTAHSELRRL